MSTVPKVIWQSYKSIETLPAESQPQMATWLDLNPGWAYHFCSDHDVEEFFKTYQEGELLDLYHAMPLMVMKADLWRYAALYQSGGIYTDIDTTCRYPLDEWLDTQVGMHVAVESDDTFFCQWTFATAPGHPVMAAVLRLIRERVERDGGVDESKPHYVHYYTGPSVWSEAIQEYLGIYATPGELQGTKWRRHGKDIVIYPSRYFGNAKITHTNASILWAKQANYGSWQKQRKDGLNPFLPVKASIPL